MSRPAVVLVLALGLACALSACGQSSSSPRKRVAQYITDIQQVETALTPPLNTVTKISAHVTGKGANNLLGKVPLSVEQRRLSGALATIRVQEARLRALPYPPAASTLRSLVLRLTGDQVALTHQIELLVAFLPRFNAAVVGLQPGLVRLEKVLSERQAAGTAAVAALYGAKARALRRFQATTRQISARLTPLAPPAVSKPAYDAQLRSLKGMGSSAGKLATALAGGNPGNVRPLLIAFDRAALATHTKAVQRQQIAAVRTYDAQTKHLAILSEDISRERLRLSNSLK